MKKLLLCLSLLGVANNVSARFPVFRFFTGAGIFSYFAHKEWRFAQDPNYYKAKAARCELRKRFLFRVRLP